MLQTKRTLALMLCAILAAPGCATTRITRTTSPAPSGDRLADRSLMAEYVQKLPVGSAIKIERTRRRTLRGTLMKATAQALFVQPRTRIAESPIEIPMDDVLSVTLETSNGASVGKAIAAGAVTAGGVVLAIFLITLAVWSD